MSNIKAINAFIGRLIVDTLYGICEDSEFSLQLIYSTDHIYNGLLMNQRIFLLVLMLKLLALVRFELVCLNIQISL